MNSKEFTPQAETVKWGCPICHGGVEGWKCLCAPTPEREAQPESMTTDDFDHIWSVK